MLHSPSKLSQRVSATLESTILEARNIERGHTRTHTQSNTLFFIKQKLISSLICKTALPSFRKYSKYGENMFNKLAFTKETIFHYKAPAYNLLLYEEYIVRAARLSSACNSAIIV